MSPNWLSRLLVGSALSIPLTSIAQSDQVSDLLVGLRTTAETGTSSAVVLDNTPLINCPSKGGKKDYRPCFASGALKNLGQPEFRLNASGDLLRLEYSFKPSVGVSAPVLREIFLSWTKTITAHTLQCGGFQYWGGKEFFATIYVEDGKFQFCRSEDSGEVQIERITLNFHRRPK